MTDAGVIYDHRGRPRFAEPPTTELTSTRVVGPANPGILSRTHFTGALPASEHSRTHWGRSLDLARIETAIRRANVGFMQQMSDMAAEVLGLDGHASSVMQKRLNRVAALDWDVEAAKGPGIDEGQAADYAEFVRYQLEQIPNFRDRLVDLAWGVFHGRAASELEWMRVGLREWHVKDLHWIHPRRLSFGPERALRVVDTWSEHGNFRDHGFDFRDWPYKFITYTPRLFCEYQEREGLAPRILYWSWFQRFGTRERLVLLEVYGKPWRIVSIDPAYQGPVNDEQLDDAFDAVNLLGATSTARLPKGTRAQVEQPSQNAGQVHQESITDARQVISKLVLGSTGTTDAVSTGLGSSIGDAHLSEEDLIIAGDARRLAEVFEDKLTDAIVVANFGPQSLRHAPRFVIRVDAPQEPEKEGRRLQVAVDLGVDVPLEQARAVLKIQEPKEGEPVLRKVARPAELGQMALPAAPEVVYAPGTAPPPGELQDLPAPVQNLPEPRAAPVPGSPPGAPPDPSALPPGPAPALSDDVDEDDAIAALAQRMTELGIPRCEHLRSNRCPVCGVERVRDVALDEAGEPRWSVAWRPIRHAAAALVPVAARDHRSPRVLAAGVSLDDVRRQLEAVLRQRHPRVDDDGFPVGPWVVDVFDATAIYEWEGQLFEVTYSVDDATAVLIVGEPARVRRAYVRTE